MLPVPTLSSSDLLFSAWRAVPGDRVLGNPAVASVRLSQLLTFLPDLGSTP
jgi:hypothetical protein